MDERNPENPDHLGTAALRRFESAWYTAPGGLRVRLGASPECSTTIVAVPDADDSRRYIALVGSKPEIIELSDDEYSSMLISRDEVTGAGWHDKDPACLIQLVGDQLVIMNVAEEERGVVVESLPAG